MICQIRLTWFDFNRMKKKNKLGAFQARCNFRKIETIEEKKDKQDKIPLGIIPKYKAVTSDDVFKFFILDLRTVDSLVLHGILGHHTHKGLNVMHFWDIHNLTITELFKRETLLFKREAIVLAGLSETCSSSYVMDFIC